jgi:hypothetical protein
MRLLYRIGKPEPETFVLQRSFFLHTAPRCGAVCIGRGRITAASMNLVDTGGRADGVCDG